MNKIKFIKTGRYATPTKPWLPQVTVVGSDKSSLDDSDSFTFSLNNTVNVDTFDDIFIKFMVKIKAAEIIEVKIEKVIEGNPAKDDKKNAEGNPAKDDKKKSGKNK